MFGHLVGRIFALIFRAYIVRVDLVKLSLWLWFSGLVMSIIAERSSRHFNNEYIYYIGLFVFGAMSVVPLQLFWGIVMLSKDNKGRDLNLLGKRIERGEDEESD